MGNFIKYGIKDLSLTNFRNYKSALLEFNCESILLSGANGVGKTSILEAISMFSFSKGLRSTKLDDVVKKGEKNATLTTKVVSSLGIVDLVASIDYHEETNGFKRKVFLDESKVLSQSDVSKYLDCLWLVPQMDNFFLQDSANKRKFIDRLVFLVDKPHAKRLNEYEKLLKERSEVLLKYNSDAKWLDLLEDKISTLSVAIIVARTDFLDRLNDMLRNDSRYKIQMNFTGELETLFQEHTFSLTVEDIIKKQLKEARKHDLLSGSTSLSVNKSKLSCFNLESKQEASKSSTGEQKMYLIEVILAFIKLVGVNNKGNLFLLLDEINVHLDSKNIAYVIERFLSFKQQIFITTTNAELFSHYNNELTNIDVGKLLKI